MSFQNEAVDVDIDEILDMDTDDIRRSFLFVSCLVLRTFDCAYLTLVSSSTESHYNVELQAI